MSRRRPVRFPVYFTQAELEAILDMSCGIAVGNYQWTDETLAAAESVGSKAAELLGRLKERAARFHPKRIDQTMRRV